MNKDDFASLQRGMAQARAYIGGERKGFAVHEPVDVRAVRSRTKLTRARFAAKYGLDARAIEQWEQGRRRPERGTEMYLRLIGLKPEAIAEIVEEVVSLAPVGVEVASATALEAAAPEAKIRTRVTA